MEDEPELQSFRLHYRVSILERLVLRTPFAAPVLAGRLSREESRRTLIDWFNLNSASADETVGEHFQDPEDRLPKLVERWVTLIRNRLASKRRPQVVDLRRDRS